MAARRTRVADASRTRDGLKAALELSSTVIGSKSRAPTAGEREVRGGEDWNMKHPFSLITSDTWKKHLS